MGLKITYLLRAQTCIWVRLLAVEFKVNHKDTDGGALTCFVSWGWRKKKLLSSSSVLFTVKLLDLGLTFSPVTSWQTTSVSTRSETLTQNEVFTVCSDTRRDPASVPRGRSRLMSREGVRTVNAFWQMTDSSGEINWRLRISDMFWGQNIKRNESKVALKLQLCLSWNVRHKLFNTSSGWDVFIVIKGCKYNLNLHFHCGTQSQIVWNFFHFAKSTFDIEFVTNSLLPELKPIPPMLVIPAEWSHYIYNNPTIQDEKKYPSSGLFILRRGSDEDTLQQSRVVSSHENIQAGLFQVRQE